MTSRIVIIGAGQSGFQLVSSLRQLGFDGSIIMIGDEPGLPYQRPPLSKAYLLGKLPPEGLVFRPEDYFIELGVERIEASVISIDRSVQRVVLDRGDPVKYDYLVLATGARPRTLAVEGAQFEGVHGLATRADADRLKNALQNGCQRAVVIGAGFIGLEFAAVARHLGLDVVVIDAASRAMARAVSPAISNYFQAQHNNDGIQFLFDEGVARIVGSNGGVSGVETLSGNVLPADLVVAGIGVIPNDRIALDAGLDVENGIVVDEHLTTSDQRIFAIGDCCNFPRQGLSGRCRLESVQNATDQARLLAERLTGGKDAPYSALPWFWSDQGSLKLQIAGLSTGCDEFLELPDSKGLSVMCFRSGMLQAVESINRPADHMAARRILSSERSPTPSDVIAPGFSLKHFSQNSAAVGVIPGFSGLN